MEGVSLPRMYVFGLEVFLGGETNEIWGGRGERTTAVQAPNLKNTNDDDYVVSNHNPPRMKLQSSNVTLLPFFGSD